MRRAAVALIALLFAAEAHAQVSGRIALLSDYRFRGVSLSSGDPALQATIAYDHADGWYGGALLSSARLAPDEPRSAQWLVYAGYARRISDSLSWELGVDYTRFTGHEHYAYPEIYVGLASEHLAGRIYYAHNYFRSGVPEVYAELNGTRPISGRFYVFAHLGMLRRNGQGADYVHVGHTRFDIRAGIGAAWRAWNAQLGWSDVRGASGGPDAFGYPTAGHSDDHAWVLSLSYAW
ncbi:TorF family putative porin [Dyella subtropica]|uniref:TorF family putative porin n=1 Tax=Dyella subtropica TaxID=2992127 RepID=UPI00224F6CF7|nr:TorF family putative porin [Dyella subtropica]